MKAHKRLVWTLSLALLAGLNLMACAAPAAAPTATSAPKPAAASPTAASKTASPAASPSAPAKAASPVASASVAAKPTATTLPAVPEDTTTVPLTRIAIPPLEGKTASIDIMEVDQDAHLLYVTDKTGNTVVVFDVSTPMAKYVRSIPLGTGPNGIVVAKNVNKVFTGNNDSTVSIIDIDPASPKVNTVIANPNTGGKQRADEIDYDPKEKKIYIANSDDGFVSVIDAVSNQIIKKIDGLGDGLEQPRYNPSDGMMYLSGSGTNSLFQFDPVKDELVNKFDVVDPCSPNGLAINPNTNQALLGCSNRSEQHTAIWDLKAGKVVATFNQVGAGDAAIYSAKADRFFFAASNFYRGPVVGIFNGSTAKFLTNVPTKSGSHTVAYDETNQVVYVQDALPNEAGIFSFPLPQ